MVNSHTKVLKIMKKRKENSVADEDIEKEIEDDEERAHGVEGESLLPRL